MPSAAVPGDNIHKMQVYLLTIKVVDYCSFCITKSKINHLTFLFAHCHGSVTIPLSIPSVLV